MTSAEIDTLFIRKYEELIELTNSSDPYEILRISGIIRQLIINGRARAP